MTERKTLSLPLEGNAPEEGPAWSGCRNPELWSCWTGQGVEVEVANLLVALVNALKPDVVVETGTHVGVATAALAAGCRANGFGHVWTLEPEEAHVIVAKEVALRSGVSDYVSFVIGDDAEAMVAEHELSGRIGFALVDCGEPMVRRANVAAMLEGHMADHGVIAVHDTSEWWDKWGDGLRGALNGAGTLHLPTPRGLTLIGPCV